MNRKQITILLLVLVVLGIAGLSVYRKQNASVGDNNPAVGKKVLPDLAYNDVAQISLREGSNQVHLVKKNDLWRVQERNDYPANYSEISEFLLKWKDLKVVQSEEVAASDLRRLWLTPDQATNNPVVVDLKDQAGKSLNTLLLGKKHMRKSNRPSLMGDMGDEGYPDGRYVSVGANSKTVALISDALSNVEPKPEQWLSKDFFKVEKARAIAVVFQNATNSWKLSRETEAGEWKLADAKPEESLDSSKVSGVSNPFSSPSFNDVQAKSASADLGLDKPLVVTVETFDNFTYSVNVGQKTNDTYALTVNVAADLPKERTPAKDEKAEDKDKLDKEFKEKQKKLEEKLAQEKPFEGWVYLVSSWTVDPVIKERAQLMVSKKEEEKKPGTTNSDASLPGDAAEPPSDTDAPDK